MLDYIVLCGAPISINFDADVSHADPRKSRGITRSNTEKRRQVVAKQLSITETPTNTGAAERSKSTKRSDSVRPKSKSVRESSTSDQQRNTLLQRNGNIFLIKRASFLFRKIPFLLSALVA